MINNKRKIINEFMKFMEDSDYGHFYDTEYNEYINKKHQFTKNYNNQKMQRDKSYIESSNKLENNLTIFTYILVIVSSFAVTIYLYGKGML
jgi:hypothetical protein